MSQPKTRLVGLNHIALEVANVEEALRFYGSIFTFDLRGKHHDDEGRTAMAFIDMGDQFLALIGGRTQAPDTGRHFGLVVEDRAGVMELARAAGATVLERGYNFCDPWGNHIEIVAYQDVQFSKTAAVLRAMNLPLVKTPDVQNELRKKDMI